MKIKALAVAVMLAAGSANAAINPGYNGQNGELFLTVFSPTLQASYNLDLGILTGDIATGTSSYSFNLSADAEYASFMAQSDLRYTVTGSFADQSVDPMFALYGLYTTSTTSAGALAAIMPGITDMEIVMGRVGDMAGNINTNAIQTGQPNSSPALFNINNSSVATVGNIGYYNTAGWNDTLGGSGFTTSTNVGSSVDFYHVAWDVDAVINEGLDRNMSILLGNWSLSNTGMLSYTAAGTNPVPVPAAVWLFGSGLLGLIGVARRKAA